MHLQRKKFVFSDSKFLPYFIPRKFEEGKIFSVEVSAIQKNEINLECLTSDISELQHRFFLCLENRLWLYDKYPFFEGQEFSFCFQGVDFFNKSFFFSNRKKKTGSFSFLSKIKESNCLFKARKDNGYVLVKGRLLRMTRGGFSSSCFGNSAYIIRSSSFYKLRKHSSYKSWFSLNLPHYGLLSYFLLIRFEKKFVAAPKTFLNRSISQKVNFYYNKNCNSKLFLLLGKPKELQFV